MSNTHDKPVQLSLFTENTSQFILITLKHYSTKDKEWLKKNKVFFEEDNKRIEIIIANNEKNNSLVFDILKHFVLRTAV